MRCTPHSDTTARLLLFVWVLGAGIALVSCTGSSGLGLVRVAPSDEAARLEHLMLDRLNRDRAEQGLPPVIWDDLLADVARAHSANMIKEAFFDHVSPTSGTYEQRLHAARVVFATARENLALDVDVESAEDHLLESPGHRANILADDVTHLGIGIVRGSGPWGENVLYVTQAFARLVELPTTDELVEQVRARLDDTREAQGLTSLQVPRALVQRTEAVLEELALPLSEGALQNVSNELSGALAGMGLKASALDMSLQTVLEPAMVTLPPAALEPGAAAVAIAARQGPNDDGTQVIFVLVVIALQ